MIEPYDVACIQTEIRVIVDISARDRLIKENLERAIELITGNIGPFGVPPKICVLPEFFLQGVTDEVRDRTIEEWRRVCIKIPGPETQRLGEVAKKLGIYIAGAAFEVDDEWPGRWLNCAFIIGPGGEVILKYRKNNDNQSYAYTATNPGDVYSQYLKRYGTLFPVVDTPVGVMGCMVCYDIFFPEVARCLAMNGAEIIIHPTVFGGIKDFKLAPTRAYENEVYFISANAGIESGCKIAMGRAAGQSMIVDFNGRVLAEGIPYGEAVVQAAIDIEALRRKRSKGSFLSQIRTSIYAHEYSKADFFPHDRWAEKPIKTRNEGPQVALETVGRLYQRGILKRPAQR